MRTFIKVPDMNFTESDAMVPGMNQVSNESLVPVMNFMNFNASE